MFRPEQNLQIQVAEYLASALPSSIIWFHPPNGGARSKVEGAIFKRMGVRPGVPDFVFVMPTGKAAFIELKAGKGRLSAPQQTFKEAATEAGAWWAECRSLPEVEGTLASWLGPFGHKLKARVTA